MLEQEGQKQAGISPGVCNFRFSAAASLKGALCLRHLKPAEPSTPSAEAFESQEASECPFPFPLSLSFAFME